MISFTKCCCCVHFVRVCPQMNSHGGSHGFPLLPQLLNNQFPTTPRNPLENNTTTCRDSRL